MTKRNSRGRMAALLVGLVMVLSLPAMAGLISQEEEVEIGREASQRLEAQYPVVRELGVQERITRVGQALAANGKRGLAYHFKVLDVDQVNALAFPGGFIYATRGLMDRMPDSQLAFVMGHEVAHVEDRHSVQQMEADLYKQIGLSALLELLGRGNVSGGTMDTVQVVDMIVSNQYSQAQEMEADRDGMRLMAAAGYDPRGAVEALQTLKSLNHEEVPGFLNSLVGTHPPTDDRIRQAQDLAREIPFDRSAPPQAPPPQAPATPQPIFTPVAP